MVRLESLLRATAIFLTILVSFTLAAPLQWLALKLKSPLAKIIPHIFCQAILGLVRVDVKISGRPSPASLIVSNHVSWADIMALRTVAPLSFLAKQEVSRWPIISTFAVLQETVFVDRQRRSSIPQANAGIAATLLRGRSVVLFPEGTTGDGTELLKFHSSHFAAARDLLACAPHFASVPIQPVAIFYSSPHATWTGDAELLPHVMLLLEKPKVQCNIIFGVPLAFTRETDCKQMARATQNAVASLLEAAKPANVQEQEKETAHLSSLTALTR